MANEIPQVYKFDSLAKYSVKDRLVIRVADLAFYFAIKLIGWTIRWETEGEENLEYATREGTPIFCLWHDRIFAGTYFLRDRGIVVLTSQSLDGEYIARFLKRFGFGTIRGSSTRGGTRALVEMIRSMRLGHPMAFTVDGPKGPRYEVKPGPIMLAKKTGNPILPFSVECSSYWTVKSWDRLQIPRPFCRARFIAGPPMKISPDANVETSRELLQRSLDELVNVGRRWSESL